MQNFRYSEAGLALTKRYEGLRLKAYQDTGGVWTVGYGHTGPDVVSGRVVTPLEAEALLRADLRDAIDCVNRALKAAVEQQHFDALVDFCFNAGRSNLLRSTLLQQVNARRFEEAAGQFGLWVTSTANPVAGCNGAGQPKAPCSGERIAPTASPRPEYCPGHRASRACPGQVSGPAGKGLDGR